MKQIKSQLETLNGFFNALGYQTGDNVCFQYIAPTGDFSKMFSKNQLTVTYPLKSVPPHREPFRIFYIVNGQGFQGADIRKCYAIFCEFDDLPLTEQREFWKKYDLPQPSLQVFTGGKSIHHYWVLDKPLTDVNAWNNLMNDLILLCGSDKSIKNANRLLRPPSFNYCDKHGKFNGEVTTIINNTGKRYSYLTLRNAIPDSRNTTNYSQELTTEQIDKLIDDIISILPSHRASGTYEDYRIFLGAIKNIKGESFAIDTASRICNDTNANWTQVIQSTNGLFNIGNIINFAKEYGNFDYVDWLKKNGNPQGKRDHRQKTVQNLEKTYNNSSDEVNELDVAQLIEQLVNKLAKPDVSEADRKKEIAKFTTVYRVSPSIIEKSIDEKLKGDNRVQDITELLPNVDDLLNVPNEQLDLSLIFDSFLEACVQETAKQVPTNPDAIISCWLPVLASVIGIRSKVVVNPATDYKLPFILRMGIVAKSGNKKSPTLKQAVKALDELDSMAYHRYQEALKDYEEDLAYYEKNKQGEKPTEPKLKQFIVQDFTIDGLLSILEDNPSLLGYIDELYGYFKRMNKFNNGDDVQRDLELFEGKKIKKSRASKDNNKYIEKHAVSLVGTIQEVALRKVLADDDDLTGVSARFLFWAGKMPLGKINFTLDAIDLNFLTISQQVIESLANLNIHSDLLLDNDAKRLFQDWQNGIMDAISTLALPQLENKYAKIEADCVKFAGILHYYHLITESDLITNEVVINGEIMRRAIVLANYYLRHFCYIVTKCQDELLNAQLMKILELVKRKGTINATDIKNYLKTDFGKTSANDINEILLNLIELGKVDRIPTKQGVKVKFKP